MKRETRVTVRLNDAEALRLDALARERCSSRAGAVRALLRDPAPSSDALTAADALGLLSESARDGSVTARVALARLLADVKPQSDPLQRRRDELAARRKARGDA